LRGYGIGALLLAAATAVFVFQNDSQVIVKFAAWTSPKVSLALVMLAAAASGALIAFFINSARYYKIVRKVRELTAENNKLNRQLRKVEPKDGANKTSASVTVSQGTDSNSYPT
jgi:uncharacterized integral membrane protein